MSLYYPGDPYWAEFTLADPNTSAAADADAPPTAVATRNGTDDSSFVLTVARLGKGRYRISGVVPARYGARDRVQVSVTATVSGADAAGVVDSFTAVSVPATTVAAATVAAAPGTVAAGALHTLGGAIPWPGAPLTLPDSENRLTKVYCTDEHCAVRARSDYLALTPQDWEVCSGTGAWFDPGDRWTLRTTDYIAATGIQAGHVVRLFEPKSVYTVAGRLYAVAAVGPNALTFRSLGQAAGMGSPPAPAGGLTGVAYECRSLYPAIESASDQINRLEGIDPNLSGKRPGDVYDDRSLRNLCVLWTLYDRYVDAMRSASGDFALKVKAIGDERDRQKDRLVLRWGKSGDQAVPTTFVGMTRVGR